MRECRTRRTYVITTYGIGEVIQQLGIRERDERVMKGHTDTPLERPCFPLIIRWVWVADQAHTFSVGTELIYVFFITSHRQPHASFH